MDPNLSIPELEGAPIELTGQLPRGIHASRNGIKTVIVATILLALAAGGGIWVGLHIAQEMRQVAALHRGGNEATAEIKRLWFAGRALKPRVSYRFTVNDTTFTGEAWVPKPLLHTIQGSNTIAIRYLPVDPALNHPSDWESSALSDWGGFIIPVLIAGALGVLLLLPLLSDRQLAGEGTPALAVVTECSRSRSTFLVKYEFRAGEVPMTGSGRSESPQEIGANIWVLHLPQNPRRNHPYPLQSYRIAQLLPTPSDDPSLGTERPSGDVELRRHL